VQVSYAWSVHKLKYFARSITCEVLLIYKITDW
jgi:hypothetical protein